jgi:hypothetical protein
MSGLRCCESQAMHVAMWQVLHGQKPVAVIFSSKAEIQQVYLSKQMRVVMY